MKIVFAILFAILLAGCGKQRMDAVPAPKVERTPATNPEAWGDPLPAPRDVTPRPEGETPPAPKASIVELREEVSASSNATQQSLTGFGVLLSKFGEVVKGIEATISTHIQAQATAYFQFQNEMKVRNEATLKAVAELKVDVNAKNQQIAALEAQVREQNTSIKAARDAFVTQVQFTEEMRDTLIASYDANVSLVVKLCGAITAVVIVLCGVIVRVIRAQSSETVSVVERMASLAENVDGPDGRNRTTRAIPALTKGV